MAKAWYEGIDGVARKVKQPYRSVDGVARKVTKGYRGVDGIARQFFDGMGSWAFQTYTNNPGNTYAAITVYDTYAGWYGSSITMRIDAKASANDAIYAHAEAKLSGNFTGGGTLNISWRSSSDPAYVDKRISFYGADGFISSEIIWQSVNAGQAVSTTHTIPSGTTVIAFDLMHHSATRSTEYFTIDSLTINGQAYL